LHAVVVQQLRRQRAHLQVLHSTRTSAQRTQGLLHCQLPSIGENCLSVELLVLKMKCARSGLRTMSYSDSVRLTAPYKNAIDTAINDANTAIANHARRQQNQPNRRR